MTALQRRSHSIGRCQLLTVASQHGYKPPPTQSMTLQDNIHSQGASQHGYKPPPTQSMTLQDNIHSQVASQHGYKPPPTQSMTLQDKIYSQHTDRNDALIAAIILLEHCKFRQCSLCFARSVLGTDSQTAFILIQMNFR